MGKSLKDFNIEQYSSSDPKNIKWTQKNNVAAKKPKSKKKPVKNVSPSNIISLKQQRKNETTCGKGFQSYHFRNLL